MKKKQAGFSLVELMIVVAIIGIMSAIAGLAYKSWTDKYNVERQTKEMYVDLMKARVDAMSRSRMFCVTFAASSYIITEDTADAAALTPDGDGDCTDPLDRTVMTKTLNYGVTFTGASTMSFNTKGRALTTKTIYVTNQRAAYDCVVIDDLRINMGRWDDKGTGSTADDECVQK